MNPLIDVVVVDTTLFDEGFVEIDLLELMNLSENVVIDCRDNLMVFHSSKFKK
jgi:hypothetical protein